MGCMKSISRAGEIVQQLGTLAAFAEVPNIYTAAHNHFFPPLSGDLLPSFAPAGAAYMWYIFIYTSKKLHTNKISISSKISKSKFIIPWQLHRCLINRTTMIY